MNSYPHELEPRSIPGQTVHALNQSQPVLTYDNELAIAAINATGSLVTDQQNLFSSSNNQNHQKQNRKKNFLSQSRERLDNFVGKISGNKQRTERERSESERDEDFRSSQQRRKREGTLSPRSTEYSLMLKVTLYNMCFLLNAKSRTILFCQRKSKVREN